MFQNTIFWKEHYSRVLIYTVYGFEVFCGHDFKKFQKEER